MESSSILSGNTNFRWGLPPPDPRYLSPPNLKTSLLLFGFELFDEVLVDCTSGHAERSKTKKRKRKERKNTKKNGRGNKKRRRKSATEVFLFLMSSDQEKFCRWQKTRFHGQLAGIAHLISQSSTHLSGAEIKKNYAPSQDFSLDKHQLQALLLLEHFNIIYCQIKILFHCPT